MDGYAVLSYAHRIGVPAVLATLVHAEGHAYRKPGAMMLLLPDGGKIGCLSPGCLEADLSLRVDGLLRTGEAELVTYNLQPEEDVVWGEAIGCGGVLRILLEPIDDTLMASLAGAYLEVESGKEAEWLRYPAKVGKLDYELISHPFVDIPLAQGRGNKNGGKDRPLLLSTVFRPRQRVFLFGADEGTVPIADVAARTGFRVAVGDWRTSMATTERFPGAEIAVGSPKEIVAALRLSSSDYVLICGHQLRLDRELLECVLPLCPAYLGIMGSKSRIRLLLEGLTRSETARIQAPVGLEIGAEGPEEIAVSIAAQLIATRKDRQRDRGVSDIAYLGHLFGGGGEQANVGSEAGTGACAR